MTKGSSFSLLPSQRSLLERLRYLIEYGDHLILLHGAAGTGKTLLAQTMLEGCDEFNQAYVEVSVDTDPAQLRSNVISQLVHQPVFDSKEPLPDTLERLLSGCQGRVILVVDNGHNLADTLLAELLSLIDGLRLPQLSITLVVVTQTDLVDRLHHELPVNFTERLLPVEVLGLSNRERQLLYRQLMVSAGRGRFANEAGIEQQLQECDGSAAAVVEIAGEQAAEVEALGLSVFHKRAIGGIAIAMMLLLLWWWTDQPSDGTPVAGKRIEVALPQATKPDAAPPEVAKSSPPEFVITPVWEVEPEPELAPELVSKGEPVATELAGEWPASTITKDKTVPPTQSETIQVIEVGSIEEVPLALGGDIALAPADTAEPIMLEPEINSKTVSVEPAPIGKPKAELEPKPLKAPALELLPLMKRPKESYVLQLAVYSEPKLVTSFVNNQSLQRTDIRVYRNRRQPKPWYILVLGGYPNKAAALAGIKALPVAIQQIKPYAKPVAAVQKELAEEQQLAEFLRKHG